MEYRLGDFHQHAKRKQAIQSHHWMKRSGMKKRRHTMKSEQKITIMKYHLRSSNTWGNTSKADRTPIGEENDNICKNFKFISPELTIIFRFLGHHHELIYILMWINSHPNIYSHFGSGWRLHTIPECKMGFRCIEMNINCLNVHAI